MKRLLAVLLLLWAVPAWADTHAAASCNNTAAQPHVQNAVDAASPGDTVTIPAGSCTWTQQLLVSKAISIVGAGSSSTIITDGVSKSYVWTDRCILIWNIQATGQHRLSAIQFHGGNTTEEDNANVGMLRIVNSTNRIDAHFRMDYCVVHTTRTAGIFFLGPVGVVDHCDFILDNSGVPGGAKFAFYVYHPTWLGVGGYGDNSWAQVVNWGSAEFLFIENCTFTTAYGSHGYAVDGLQGERVVFRYNTFTNATLANHGTESNGRGRSCRAMEIYENQFVFNNPAFTITSAVGSRGGTTLVYNNDLTTSGGAYCETFVDYTDLRVGTSYAPWGQCNGASVWDQNADAYGYRCLDQPGAGAGTYISGDTPTPEGWPNQTLEPCYAWGNTRNGSTLDGDQGVTRVANIVIQNRDFYRSAKGGYTAYTYPHPLVGGASLPSAPINVRIR